MLGVYENWLRTHNLVPTYPWDGSDFSEWDTGDEANVGLGLPLPSSLEPTSLSDKARAAHQRAAPTSSEHVHFQEVDEAGVVAPTHGKDQHHDPSPQPSRAVRPSFALEFDDADWKATGDHVDELMFLWNGLPETSHVELYLPHVRAETVLNLRNVRHAPRDVRIIDEHRLLLLPVGVTYVPLPPTPEQRVGGVVTITLPDGVRHGQGWAVDVLQLRGNERVTLGAFRLDIRVDKDLADLAEAELRLLDVLFERRSLMRPGDRWLPILDRRIATTRARARAFAERAGLPWRDPTTWKDADGNQHDLAGPRVRVVLERIETRKDFDPWIKGRGEISFAARVASSDNGGIEQRTRLPERGVWKISDQPGKNVIEPEATLFVGHAATNLGIEIVGTERDTFDPDDWMGKYTRSLRGPSNEWFGSYGPAPGQISAEDVGPWRVWLRIERGGT